MIRLARAVLGGVLVLLLSILALIDNNPEQEVVTHELIAS